MSYAFTKVTTTTSNGSKIFNWISLTNVINISTPSDLEGDIDGDDGGFVVATNTSNQAEDGTVVTLTNGSRLVVDETPEEIFNSVVFVHRPQISFADNVTGKA
tara:strand:+ start:50203 stop:50511 length:309 start_codon:yes stop_codon:yes gene_type:complete